MKKLILLLLLIVPIYLVGKNVKRETILKVAAKVYMKDFPGSQNVAFEDVIAVKNETDTLYYVVSYPKDGFVIVSADSSAPPVLGNCKKGAYDPEIMPPGLLVLLERYKFSIAELKAKGIKQSDKIKEQWDEYTDENYLTLKSYSVGDNMIDTEWGQWSEFNRFCPTGCPAGCSAVAMAQVLWYWNCRIVSDWESYDWKWMNLYTSDDDNASLIYHCGLACDTNYDTDGSTSTPNKIKNGLNDHMGCKSDVDVIWQNSHLFDWRDWLEDEIDLERPIIYNAGNFSFAGHSWVISGYDSTGDFFCNWGWNGDYNGYFSLGDFSTPNGSFNTFDSAVIKIIPEQPNGVGYPIVSAQTFTYNPNGHILTVQGVYGATSYEWSSSSGTISGNGTTATLFSNCNTVVSVRAYNDHCQIYSDYSTALITILDKDPIVMSISGPSSIGTYQPATYYAELLNYDRPPYDYYWGTGPSSGVSITSYGQSASIMFTIPGYYQVVTKAHNSSGWSDPVIKMVSVNSGYSGYSMIISPNPSTEETTVVLVNDNKEALAALTEWDYEIYDSMQGLKEKKTKLKGTQAKINTSGWNDGIYIIRAKIGDEVITEKLVVKH